MAKSVTTDPQKTWAQTEEPFKEYLHEIFTQIQGVSERSDATVPDTQVDPDVDSDVYNFVFPKRGLAIIFNNVNFTLLPPGVDSDSFKIGGLQDESDLKKSFVSLGFDTIVFRDLKAKQMFLAAKEASRLYKHEEADCFVCVFISHGVDSLCYDASGRNIVKNLIYGCDSVPVLTVSLVQCFKNDQCLSLKNKPRLFFVQAGRGTKTDDGCMQASQNPEQQHFSMNPVNLENIHLSDEDQCGGNVESTLAPDFMIMYATPSGYRTWRDKNGSWFLQELCKFLQLEDIGHFSFLKGLTHVSSQVASNYESLTKDRANHGKKAMPVVESMLTRDLFMSKKEITHALHAST